MSPYIYQKPLLGWGSNGVPDKIKNSDLIKGGISAEFGHLHNYHIRLIVCYGLVGFILVNGVYVWFIVSGYKIRNEISFGNEWLLLSVCFLSYWLVINCFEGFNAFWSGVFCHNLIVGCLYANYLGEKSNVIDKTPNAEAIL